MKKEGRVCISGIDTRNITKKIRDNGSCNALIHYPDGKFSSIKELKEELKFFPSMAKLDLATDVSSQIVYTWINQKKKALNPTKKKKNLFLILELNY